MQWATVALECMATTTCWGPELVEGDRLASLDLEDLVLDLVMVALVAEELGVAEVLEEELEVETLEEVEAGTLEEEVVQTLEEVMVGVAWVDWEEVQDLVGLVMEV